MSVSGCKCNFCYICFSFLVGGCSSELTLPLASPTSLVWPSRFTRALPPRVVEPPDSWKHSSTPSKVEFSYRFVIRFNSSTSWWYTRRTPHLITFIWGLKVSNLNLTWRSNIFKWEGKNWYQRWSDEMLPSFHLTVMLPKLYLSPWKKHCKGKSAFVSEEAHPSFSEEAHPSYSKVLCMDTNGCWQPCQTWLHG